MTSQGFLGHLGSGSEPVAPHLEVMNGSHFEGVPQPDPQGTYILTMVINRLPNALGLRESNRHVPLLPTGGYAV